MKHALVIEGGGMKGAYSNGVLTAFERAGYRPFDLVAGTSAGGAMAAWYSAGQAEFAEATWNYARDKRIMDLWRFYSGRGPFLDHEALLTIVYEKEMPIDQAAIRRSPHPVVVNASCVETGETVHKDLRHAPIIPWLKATGRLPLASGHPVLIDGKHYLDGGITEHIPTEWAIAQGCKRITAIVNKPPGLPTADNRFFTALAARRYPKLAAGIRGHQQLKHQAITFLESPPKGIHVTIIRPARPTGLHRLSRDLDTIRAGILQGHRDGAAHLKALEKTGAS